MDRDCHLAELEDLILFLFDQDVDDAIFAKQVTHMQVNYKCGPANAETTRRSLRMRHTVIVEGVIASTSESDTDTRDRANSKQSSNWSQQLIARQPPLNDPPNKPHIWLQGLDSQLSNEPTGFFLRCLQQKLNLPRGPLQVGMISLSIYIYIYSMVFWPS